MSGQCTDDIAGESARTPWQHLQQLTESGDMVTRVAAERLIGAFAGEDHFHILTGQPAQLIQWDGVRMAERLIVKVDQPRQYLLESINSGNSDMMLGAGTRRRIVRKRTLIPC